MRVRYSFSSRKTGHIKNIRKQRKKFPEITEKIMNDSDILIEVLDARFVKKTKSREIEEFVNKSEKKIIYVINKVDLIEKKDLDEYPKESVFVSCKERGGISELRNRIKIIASQLKKEKVVVGVLGYPNTGKSSLINLLIGKSSAPTSSQAGFTKNLQKLRLARGIVLLDSPGVIPREEYSSIDFKKIARHAQIGARTYSKVKDPEHVIVEIMKEYPGVLEKHYGIDSEGNTEILLEILGRKKSFLKKGGIVEVDKTSRFILRDWQEGKIKIGKQDKESE